MSFLSDSLKAYLKNPLIILIFVAQYFVLSLFLFNAKLRFPSLILEIAFLLVFGFVFLIVNAFFISLFIGGSHLALKNKFSFKDSLRYGKFTWGNFILLAFICILTFVMFYLSNFIGNLGKNYLGGDYGFYLAVIVFFAGLLSIILLSFANCDYTLKNHKLSKSVKVSFKYCRKHYFSVLGIAIEFLIASFFISLIPNNLVKDVVSYVLVYPVIILTLVSLFDHVSGK